MIILTLSVLLFEKLQISISVGEIAAIDGLLSR